MKKLIITLAFFISTLTFVSAQVLPSFQFGIKGGANLTSVSTSGETFNSSNQAGYLVGFWARFGALGFNFQPEIYYTAKYVDIYNSSNETHAKFNSIDVPLLFGGKVGAFGFGARFYTGPLLSFAINKEQSIRTAAADAIALDYHDQNFAWQFGVGVDVKQISVDLRYEAGITKQDYGAFQTRVNLFNLTLAYRLLKL